MSDEPPFISHEHQCWRQHPHGGMHECEHCDTAWATAPLSVCGDRCRDDGCPFDRTEDAPADCARTVEHRDAVRAFGIEPPFICAPDEAERDLKRRYGDDYVPWWKRGQPEADDE